jgi:hypothetical protein
MVLHLKYSDNSTDQTLGSKGLPASPVAIAHFGRIRDYRIRPELWPEVKIQGS